MLPGMSVSASPEEPRISALVQIVATGTPGGPVPAGFPADALARECAPILAALDEDPAVEHHETATLLVLLGRRAALLGLQPLHLARLSDVLGGRAVPVSDDDAGGRRAAWPLLLEGYLAGQREAQRAEMLASLEAAQPIARWAPGCVLWCVCGPLSAGAMEASGERMARLAHREGAVAAVLDLQGAPPPTEGRRAALAHVLELLRTTGCEPLVSRPSDAWRGALEREAGAGLQSFDSLEAAAAHAEMRAGWRRFPWPPWRRPARRPPST